MGSLSEFAASTTRKRTCAVCTRLPEQVLVEVNEGLRGRVGPTIVARWLASEGHGVTPSQLAHHKREGHADVDA